MFKLKYVALALSAALALAGCSSPKHEPAELVKITPIINVTEEWSKNVSSSESFLYPTIASEAVYAAGGKTLYRMDVNNGNVLWTVDLDSPVTGGVGSDGYYTAVATEDGKLTVVDSDGAKLWDYALTSKLQGPPVVVQDMVIVRTADTRITALKASTGEVQWTYQRTQPALTVRVPTVMTAMQNVLFAGQPNGHMVVLDIGSGQQVFEFPVGQPKGITEVERLIDVVGAPAMDGNMFCASAYQGAVTCVDTQNGQMLWTKRADAVSGPAIDSENVYVVETDGVVQAFYRESGELRWTNDTMKYRGLSSPVVVPGGMAVGDEEGYIHVLSPRTGEEIGRTRLSGAIVVPPVPYLNGAVFQTQKGDVAYVVTR